MEPYALCAGRSLSLRTVQLGKQISFAWNEPLHRVVTVLVSAPIKIDFLHVHTT